MTKIMTISGNVHNLSHHWIEGFLYAVDTFWVRSVCFKTKWMKTWLIVLECQFISKPNIDIVRDYICLCHESLCHGQEFSGNSTFPCLKIPPIKLCSVAYFQNDVSCFWHRYQNGFSIWYIYIWVAYHHMSPLQNILGTVR